jgi:hypothetical protein
MNTDLHFSSKDDTHRTPRWLLEPVVAVLGEIDLDPCSNLSGPPHVPARHHFTCRENGLAQPWFGHVFMNPPYGRAIPNWVRKLGSEYGAHRVQAAIALVPARPGNKWFALLRAYWRCYLRGRVRFIGNAGAAPFPSMVVYLGEELARFEQQFQPLGDIYPPAIPRPSNVLPLFEEQTDEAPRSS